MNHIFFNYLIKTFKLAIIGVLTIILVRTFIVEPGRTNGRSMENTYIDNDIFLVNKFILLFRKPKRGDIIQLIDKEDKILVKRIIGLPGESIYIKSNKVFVIENSKKEYKLEEFYLKPNIITRSKDGAATIYEISKNEYFVLGDNRGQSIDSRHFGPVHRSYINGITTKPFF